MTQGRPPNVDGKQIDTDVRMLRLAARAAARGFGHVEPNPMVGCVIGRNDGTILAIGHHRRFGGPHAEVEALNACAAADHDPRGATAWVTLEPCSHFGKQPPCCNALIRAGVARVVAARRDPHPVSAGGAERLASAGIRFDIVPCDQALAVGDPFVKRIKTGLPWVIAKWAQTIDGKIADRFGASKWISCEASRRRVHAWRGRVDAILTAIGTVKADDPLLTARGVRPRRIARRIVIDPRLEIPETSALVQSVRSAPLMIVADHLEGDAALKRDRLVRAGAEVIEWSSRIDAIPLPMVLRSLTERHGVSTVLVEAGPGLLGRLFADHLVDEARVFISPKVLGDPTAPSAAQLRHAVPLAAAASLSLIRAGRCGRDALLCFGPSR